MEQLSAASDALKSRNEALCDDVASLSQAVSDVRSEYFCVIFVFFHISVRDFGVIDF